MFNKIIFLFLIGAAYSNCISLSMPEHITITSQHVDDCTQEIRVSISLTKKDFIYKDFITFSVAHPLVCVSPWKTESISFPHYDPLFKGTKEIFKKNILITLTVSAHTRMNDPVYLYFTYYQRSEKKIKQLAYELFFNDEQGTTINSSSLHTHLEISGQQEKVKYPHSVPFNVSLTHLFTTAKQYFSSCTINPIIQIICIMLLIILSVLPSCFFKKRQHLSTQLNESIMLISATSYFILLGYLLHHAYKTLPEYIIAPIITITIFSIGIFYIKKSTYLQWKYLCALCNLCGGLCITITMPLLFKTIQLLDAYF